LFYSKESILGLLKTKKIEITPFEEKYLGPISYEMHLGDNISIPSPLNNEYDGMKPKEKSMNDIKIGEEGYLLLPKQFVIVKTIEKLFCDSSIMGIFDGKASLAQIGLFSNISSTLIEPGMNSEITCEIFNCSDFPIRLFCNQKIGQVFFSNLE